MVRIPKHHKRTHTARRARLRWIETLEHRQLLASDFSFTDLGTYLADTLLANLQQQVTQTAFDDFSAPLVGDKIDENFETLELFPESMREELRTALAAIDDTEGTSQQIETLLVDTLGQVLENYGMSQVVEWLEPFDPETGQFSVQLTLGHEAVQVPIVQVDERLGIPFLPIELTGELNIDVTAGLAFAPLIVTFDADDGTFMANFDSTMEELTISVAVELDDTSFTAAFGMFELVTIEDAGSGVSAQLAIDLDDDGNVTNVVSLNTSIAVHLAVTAAATAYLPSISFELDWVPGSADWAGEEVQITDVRAGLGSVLSSVLGPVISYIDPIIEPIHTTVRWANEPIPVIDRLTGLDITLLDVFEFVSGLADIPEEYQLIIDAAINATELFDSFGDFDCGQGEGCYIDLGDFDFAGSGPLNEKQAGLPSELFEGTLDALSDLDISGIAGSFDASQLGLQIKGYLDGTPLENLGNSIAETLYSTLNGVSYEFPILKEPRNLIKLLLGQPEAVDIFEFSAFFLEAADFQQDFGSPLQAGLTAGLTFDLDPVVNLQLGYDAVGLVSAIRQGDASRLADGLWVSRRVDDDDLIRGVSLNSSVSAAVGASYVVLHADIEGTISADLALEIPDPVADDGDDKIRLTDELGPTLFNVNGGIGGEISVEVQVGFRAFGKCFCVGKEWVLAEKQFGGFNLSAIPNPFYNSPVSNPELARVVGDTLLLHMGSEAGWRSAELPADDDEVFAVYMQQTPDGEQLAVSFEGAVQLFSMDDLAGVVTIQAFAGNGDDRIIIAEDVPFDGQLAGEDGDDQLIYLGTGASLLLGGHGNDYLQGEGVANSLSGEWGDDHVLAGANGLAMSNLLAGGPDNDFVEAGSGETWMWGGDGQDVLQAGQGVTIQIGGDGDDVLIAGTGDITMAGEAGNDDYHAGEGYNAILETTGDFDHNRFNWTVGDGNLDINAQEGLNTLSIQGSDADEAFAVNNSLDAPYTLHIEAPNGRQIRARLIEVLAVDGAGGADTIDLHLINDLDLKHVAINGTDNLAIDGASDVINVDASKSDDELTLSAHLVTIQDPLHSPNDPPLQGGMMALQGLTYSVSAMVNPEDQYHLATFAGDDSVSVYGATGTLYLHTAEGHDDVTLFVDELGYLNLPPHAPLPGYQAPVNYLAGSGVNSLRVTAERSNISTAFDVTDQVISSDDDDFSVEYSGDAFSLISVVGSKSHDDIRVLSTRESTYLILGKEGNDGVLVGQNRSLENIRGAVQFGGDAGDDHLVLDDGAAKTGNALVHIGPAQVTGIAGPTDATVIGYWDASVEVIGSDKPDLVELFRLANPAAVATVRGGDGNDRLEVLGLTHLSAFHGGAGDDIVATVGNNLDSIAATLAVFGQEGNDRLNVRDNQAPVAHSYGLDSTSLWRGAAKFDFDASLEELELIATRWDDDLFIASEPLVCQVSLDMLNGYDTVWGPNQDSTWTIVGPNAGRYAAATDFLAEQVNGGNRADEFHIEEPAQLVIDGGGGPAIDSVILAQATPGSVNLESRSVNGGTTFDEIERIVGGDGSDTLHGDDFDNVWKVVGVAEGQVLTSWGTVGFLGFENLVGGPQNDQFVMHPGGLIPEDVNGRAGVDSLDYSPYAVPVAVDLEAQTATGVGQNVINIERVRGGSGDDILLGSKQADFLMGGSGNDLILGRAGDDQIFGDLGNDWIVGGTGTDWIEGGMGDDLLATDSTVFDTQLSSLQRIMGVWTRDDLDYRTRSRLIQRHGQANGRQTLRRKTDIDDLTADTVSGGTGMDFFLTGVGDIISDLQPGEFAV